MDGIPEVTLDTTLAELYKIGQNGERLPKIALIPCGWSAGMSMGHGMPRNKRYMVHEPFTTGKRDTECTNLPPAQLLDIQAKLLAMISQRDTFAAGNMLSIQFTFDRADRDPPYTQTEGLETMKILPEHQRPQYIYCDEWKDVPPAIKKHQIDALSLKIPIDRAEPYPQIMDMPTWAYLNSKTAIYESGLPTPKTITIEPDFCEIEPEKCCSSCASNHSAVEIPDTCTGKRLPWLREQISHISSALKSRELPYVVKLAYSAGGGGAWILTSESERQDFLHQAQTVIFPKVLSTWTALNKELKPATVLVMDYAEDILHSWGLTFFVTRTGQPIFLSATDQKLLEGKLWTGSWIDYSQQGALEKKFNSIMHKITEFVYQRQKQGHRYYGPMGADILEVSPPNGKHEPSDDEYLIVDLNVRIPGSLTLSFLRSHFTSSASRPDGPLDYATNFLVAISMDREAFITQFKHEFSVTKAIVITAWYYEQHSKQSHAALIVAGRTAEEMDALTARINEFAQVFRL